MRQTLLGLTFFFTMTVAYGQKQGNIWYFPQYSGLDFTTNTPILLSDGQISNSEGCSSISDSAGNLLFYASPTSTWNRNHLLMPNGTGLMGGNSSTQGVLIVPQPGSNNLFYVFTLDEFQNNLINGLRYSIVDMCLDNGNGDVEALSKNTLLLNEAGEKQAATYHSNGTDVWLVTRKHLTNEFYSYLITSSGISSPIISSIGWENPSQAIPNAIGQMKISPDGSKIAFAVGNQVPNIVQLFDFSNSTGVVSNLVDLPTSTNTGSPYGVSFSPDNSKLYIWGPSPTGLNQFDLSSNIPDTIINSLYSVPWSGGYGGTGLQLAKNGKIYVCQPPNIGVINFPNLAGSACDFIGNTIASTSYYSLPGFIDSYNYKNGIPDCSLGVSETELENLISINPNPFSLETNITVDKFLKNGLLIIYNLYGQPVKRIKNINGPTITVNRDNLSSGAYYLQISHENKIITTAKLLITDN